MPRNITQPDPPDIVADFDGAESVANELVAINHSEEVRDKQSMIKAPIFLLEQGWFAVLMLGICRY